MKRLFPILSYIFHPLFISFYTIVIYLFSIKSNNFINEINYIYKAFIITVFIPLIIFYLLIRFKKIENSMINNVNERKTPLFLQLISYFITTLSLVNYSDRYLLNYFIANGISTIIALYFTFLNKKISLHMLSITGMSSWIILNHIKLDSLYFLCLTITLLVLSSCVAISRLVMKAHTRTELILGTLSGIIPQIILFILQQ
ncbi:hypothetical protein V3470_11445 [Flavobacterium oreochromis]|uniref:Phosphatase PAP2 family protein n=1 Tax=Flavobacterium oreochromis TaxID=2906078 RepID=A0ABW8P4S4_9FLAO|nr:hypothetical protein [Flavobacterium oreochromis]